mgnify:CR=1 FL=1
MELNLIDNYFNDSLKKINLIANRLCKDFNSSNIRFVKIDNFLPIELALYLESVFPKVSSESNLKSRRYQIGKHIISKDLKNTHLLDEALLKMLENFKKNEFINFLKKVSGIDDLKADYDDWGGGIQQSERGGFLRRHLDAPNKDNNKNIFRRLNVIFYLNSNWKASYKGDLEIWDNQHSNKSIFKVSPIINRLIIFETSDKSWHGFPEKLNCPKNLTRKSIALFYYSNNQGLQNRKQIGPAWFDEMK